MLFPTYYITFDQQKLSLVEYFIVLWFITCMFEHLKSPTNIFLEWKKKKVVLIIKKYFMEGLNNDVLQYLIKVFGFFVHNGTY